MELDLIKEFEVYQNQRWFFVGFYILESVIEEQEETTQYVRGIK
tara:strand:- start:443 stop:574 length:132 start_codon:yes stop_codon:yes gene_type:complete